MMPQHFRFSALFLGQRYEASKLMKGEYGFAESLIVSNVPYRMNPTGSIQPMEILFTTETASETMNTGTNGPVRMTLGYYNSYGDMRTLSYSDIRPYLDGNDKRFLAGNTAKIRLLASDISELRWIELEPYRSDTDTSAETAMWSLNELSVKQGENGFESTRSVGSLIVEGEPLRVSMANLLLTAEVSYGEGVEVETLKLTGGTADIQLKSGESLGVKATLTGSDEGVDVKLTSLDPTSGAIGKADLSDTRGYTQEILNAKAAQASTPEEAEVWRNAELQPGELNVSDLKNIVFTPPRNYTDGSLSYRLTISAKEAPAAAVVINVTVTNETDPTKTTLEDVIRELMQQQRQSMQQMQDEIDKLNDQNGTDTGSTEVGGTDTGVEGET